MSLRGPVLNPYGEARSAELYGWDGWDGISKVSFNFVHTLWVYRTFMCILIIYVLKNCHQHSYGFQNFMTSWGSWSKISKIKQVGVVSFFRSKSSLFIFTTTWEQCFFFQWHFFVAVANLVLKIATATFGLPLALFLKFATGNLKSLTGTFSKIATANLQFHWHFCNTNCHWQFCGFTGNFIINFLYYRKDIYYSTTLSTRTTPLGRTLNC